MSQTCANNSIHNESNFNCDLNENFNINDYQVFTKCKGFKILHFNAQNIIRKIDEFKILCSILLPDILWFHDTSSSDTCSSDSCSSNVCSSDICSSETFVRLRHLFV